jgi:protein-disulfide isomerase
MPPKQRPNRVELPGASRRPSTPLLLGLLGAAVVVTAGAIALSLTHGSGHKTTAPTTVAGDLGILEGIPQHGLVLGNPKARVTLTEYVDTSCPICRDYVLGTFPTISTKYVRSGKVKVEARVVDFVGKSSPRGRQLVLAAALQNKAWQLLELLYGNQGDERTVWLTDDFARALAGKIPGLDVGRLFADAADATVKAEAAKQDTQATADGIPGTPAFLITSASGKRSPFTSGNPGTAAFVTALDSALQG